MFPVWEYLISSISVLSMDVSYCEGTVMLYRAHSPCITRMMMDGVGNTPQFSGGEQHCLRELKISVLSF